MNTVKWGIIGCGDVAEVKSGPAFQKVPQSELIGVMRRNAEKAEDFARRHKVSYWTNKAEYILSHKEINAVYIATPPSTHLKYTLDAIAAGKHVYLEKPMALTALESEQICKTLEGNSVKLTVAHYRRELPAFKKVKDILKEQLIGAVLYADIQILQSKESNIIADTEVNWRLNPDVSGGGYFYDLAPHQIDLMYHYFGGIDKVSGFATSSSNNSLIEDTVNGIIIFKNGIQFRGLWNFTSIKNRKDECIIYGTKGSVCFSFYGDTVLLKTDTTEEVFSFKNPKHIQQPMITEVVNYFLGKVENPCSAKEGLIVMKTLEQLSGRS